MDIIKCVVSLYVSYYILILLTVFQTPHITRKETNKMCHLQLNNTLDLYSKKVNE